MTEIAGKSAVVTGAGSGIGRGLSIELARRNISVVVADILADNAKQVADEITAAGGTAIPVHCDVCERESIEHLLQASKSAFGPIQLLFVNAGATSFDQLLDMSDADVDWIIQVNLMGVINTTRAFLPEMIATGGGHVCATASMAGLLPTWIPDHGPYSAAKMGAIGFMLNMQLELESQGVNTTIYCPGAVASGMKENNSRYRPARFGGASEGGVRISETSIVHSALPFYRPEAIAPMVLNAIENNRPFVFDHSEQRESFRKYYSNIVESCFDDADAWENAHGKPEPNPTGAVLVTK